MTAVAELQPLALVVEDKAPLREARILLLEMNGFAAIGASSKRDAERELKACPSVDVMVTDVNLDDQLPADRSGLDLARDVKRRFPDLPIVGYSGMFAEGDLPKDALSAFDMVMLKGNQDVQTLKAQVGNVKKRALAYRDARQRVAERELSRLSKRYGIDAYDFDLLREFLPGLTAGASPERSSIEDVLRIAGYRLQIIDRWPEPSSESSVVLKTAVPVWLRGADDAVIAEAYGFPALYANGSDEKDAMTRLLLLMEGYHRDFMDGQADDLGVEMIRMRDYLAQLFG